MKTAIYVSLLLTCALMPKARAQTESHDPCPAISFRIDTYRSRGKRIQLEIYRPSITGKLPVVIMLHGAAGVFSRDNVSGVPERDNFGEKAFACRGFLVLLPHYFDSTGQKSALGHDDIEHGSQPWLAAVEDAVTYAMKLRNTDKRRIFLFGESLGGFLSIAVAARTPHVKAISTFGAGRPPDTCLQRLPPVLLQHGEDDDVVSLSDVFRLSGALKTAGRPVHMKTYPRVGHYLTPESRAEILRTAAGFFEHVR